MLIGFHSFGCGLIVLPHTPQKYRTFMQGDYDNNETLAFYSKIVKLMLTMPMFVIIQYSGTVCRDHEG